MSLDAYGSLLGSVVPSCVDWRVVSFGACGRGCVDLGCANRGCWWVVGFVAWGWGMPSSCVGHGCES